jgi:hypothetical protein
VVLPSVGSRVSSHSIVVAAEETAATTAEETAVVVDREVEIIFSFILLCDSSSRGRLPFERGGVVAVRFAYVPLNGSPDPGTSRSSLVRLVVSVHNSIACTWRSLVIFIVVRSVIGARPKE